MSHDLEKLANGHSFAYNIEEGLPWHGLGTGVHGMMTASQAITSSGLGWTVIKEPARRNDKIILDENGKPYKFWIVRESDDKELGIVGKDYKPVQNLEAFEFFDTLVDSGEAKYDTAGALAGGKRIFLTAKIGDEFQVAGQDAHQMWLVLLSSHDGSKSLTMLTTIVRVVCANTEQMALNNAKSSWTMTHRTTLSGKVQEARESLKLSHKYRDAFDIEMTKLLDVEMTNDKFREIMTDVLPAQKRQLPKNLDALTGIFENSPTIVDAGLAGTGLGAYNAVTEWLTHGREVRSVEARMVNSVWGFGAQTRNKTYKRIAALVD